MIKNTVADFFTQEELIQIYEKAGSPQQAALRAAAEELFPQRMGSDTPPMLKVEEGLHGRAFCRTEDRKTAEVPKYTIKSGQCSWVGVFEDGTALPY
jgi:hypothetical protein